MEERDKSAMWDYDFVVMLYSFKLSMVIGFLWIIFSILGGIVIKL